MTAAPAAPAVTKPPVRDTSAASNNLLPIAGGAAGLGLLGLIGLGLTMRRRKHRRDEEEIAAAEQAQLASEGPVQADPLFAEPAFAPLAAEPAVAAPAVASAPLAAEPAVAATVAASESAALPAACDEAAPGSHVEAACDGPTDDNPSLSIKKRLKRAQFFDQREQLAAAGMAVPVETDAGLPDALIEEQAAAPGVREPA
jgi:hypothetical protein